METESKKVIRLTLAVVALLTAWLLHRGLQHIAMAANLSNPLLAGAIPLSAAIAVIVALAAYVMVLRHAVAMNFLMEVHGELKKVVWPTRKETVLSTVVVVVLVLITAVLLWGIDLFWSWTIRQVL